MEIRFETITLLLLIAALAAIVSRRLRLPYTVGLVATGILMAALPFAPHMTLTHDLLFTALLPPLLFEGAYHLHWQSLRQDLPLLAALATVGVLLASTVTTLGVHFLLGWPWIAAATFGALISATDPVSVIATFKEARVGGRLRLLIEAESLFNDGTAAVLFVVMLAVAGGQTPAPLTIGWLLLKSTGGGILCGTIVAVAAILLAGRTDDHLVEISITVVAAYGSFLLADRLGLSGVLATIAAGLVLGNFNPGGAITNLGRETIETMWEYASFVANSIIFMLIGMHEATQNLRELWPWAPVAITVILASRAATVYPCCFALRGTRMRVSAKHQLVLFWGGLRGALALALAMSLPAEMPCREAILSVSFAVVAFSIFVQGLTMTPLLRKIGEIAWVTKDKSCD